MAKRTPKIEALADDLVILGDLCGTKHRSYEARLKCGEQATRKRSVGFSLVGPWKPAFRLLTNLEELDVQQFEMLPPEIAAFTKLKRLSLFIMAALPPEIGNLVNLEELEITNNELEVLPPEIGNLTKLKRISLNRNLQLHTLTPVLG